MKGTPDVSIIVPHFNVPPAYVRGCLESVQNQNYPHEHLEVVVVDDGSDLGHREALEREVRRLEGIETIFIPHARNQGLPAARNTAIRNSNANYILVLDADDILEPTAVRGCMAAMRDGVVLVYSDHVKYEEDMANVLHIRDKEIVHLLHTTYKGTVHDPLLHFCFVGHVRMYDKQTVLEAGGYNLSLREGGEDFEFFLRLSELSADVNFIHLASRLCRYRGRDGSLSNGKQRQKALTTIGSFLETALRKRSIPFSEVKYSGRIAPQENSFFDIYQDGTLVEVPWLDYSSMSLRQPDEARRVAAGSRTT